MANNNHFELTLDTIAPVGSITRNNEYINANEALTITFGDASFMKLWFNANATGTVTDPEYPSAPIPVAATATTAFTTDGTYYYHMTLIDDVGNESGVYDTARIVFDITAPTLTSAIFTGQPQVTNQLVNSVTINFNDALSGVETLVFTNSDLENSPVSVSVSGTSYVGNITFKSTAADGSKAINLKLIDKAGNEASFVGGTAPNNLVITLDQTQAGGTLLLKDASGNPLPANTNDNRFKPLIDVDSNDVVGFKIWGDITGHTTEPATYTSVPAGTDPIDICAVLGVDNLTFTTGNGTKTIYAKIIDISGNETPLTAATVGYYYLVITPTISSNKDWINGTDTATLTMTDGASTPPGLATFTLKVGNDVISTTSAQTFALDASKQMVEGNNTITLTIVDNAGNTGTATCVVGLDTTAPVVTAPTLETWYNAPFSFSLTGSDAGSGDVKYYIWANNSAASETVPSGTTEIPWTAATQVIAASDINFSTVAQTDSDYLHIKAVDDVGNASYTHVQFGYDSGSPTCSVQFTQTAYSSTTAAVNIIANDETSGVSQLMITGNSNDIDSSSVAFNTWVPFVSSKSIVFTVGDGYKQITLKVRDAAGNESNVASATSELDTSDPAPDIKLRQADDSGPKDDPSNVETLAARISYSDDIIGTVQYKLYGDFTFNSQQSQGRSEASIEWADFPAFVIGQNYVLMSNMYCTTGSGLKTIYLKIKDSAGNVATTHGSFTYSTAVPTVEVSNLDYARISETHVLRRNSANAEVPDKYCDETHFSFTPDQNMQAYKVVAYATASAAEAGSHLDPAIGTTNGSINMFNSGLDTIATVNAVINGKDYAIALGGDGTGGARDAEINGAHIVVVYVQNMAGTWSVAAQFSI